jgi:hypothetical protein
MSPHHHSNIAPAMPASSRSPLGLSTDQRGTKLVKMTTELSQNDLSVAKEKGKFTKFLSFQPNGSPAKTIYLDNRDLAQYHSIILIYCFQLYIDPE